MAHQSRWGWYPCDYGTFQLLKKLNARYEKALHLFAAWKRWQRKQPQNRVCRQKVMDNEGRKIGSRIIGFRPEPPLDPLFCHRQKVVRHWTQEGKHFSEEQAVERIVFSDQGVPEAYRSARRPAPTADQVIPLPLTADMIVRLANDAEAGAQAIE